MNNRFKAALLLLSLATITPQMQAAWYSPWVAGIQSAANTVNQVHKNVKNYLFPAPAARPAVPAASNPGIFARVAQWWSGNQKTAAQKAALALKDAAHNIQEYTNDQAKIRGLVKGIEQRDKLLKLSKDTVGQRDEHIESLNEQLANGNTKYLNKTKELQEQLDLAKTSEDINQQAHLDLLRTAEAMEKDRNNIAHQLELTKTKANDLELDLKIAQHEASKTIVEAEKTTVAKHASTVIAGTAFNNLRDMRNEFADLKETVLNEHDEFRTNIEALQQSFEYGNGNLNISDLAASVKKSKSQEKEKQKILTPPSTATMAKSFTFVSHLQDDTKLPANKTMSDKEVLAAIFKGQKTIKSEKQEDEINAIVGLHWALYNIAISKGEKFDEGTFVIINKNNNIPNFLFEYMKKHNPKITGTAKDPANHFADNAYAYSRESSHFKHLQKQYPHYGIDIRLNNDNQKYAPTSASLPAEKRHILLGMLDKNTGKFFLKMENYGLNNDELTAHTTEFITAQWRKCGYTQTTDDDASYRKERIPKLFLEEFKQAVLQNPLLSIDDKNELIHIAKIEGIKTLVSKKALTSEKLSELAQKYSKQYDHIEHRTGREVIIDDEEFEKYIKS